MMSIKRLLLAEDDLDDQELFKIFLHHRKDIHIMPVVENGVVLFDTLERIAEPDFLPHFIILDQNMPKRTGLQTLQLLKDTPRYAGIPVFVYSTYTDDKLKMECIANGAFDVVGKPIAERGYHDMIDIFLKMLDK